jgi:ketosteroid isomerase-like protein
MTEPLPAPIRAVVDATNAGDTEAFVAAFTDDAVINDWGREFTGHDGARSWDSTDNIGVHAHFDVEDVVPGPGQDEYTVTLTVTSERFNGTGPVRFTVRDGLVSALRIDPS